MDVASAIVHAAPGQGASVRTQLAAMPGVEIHAETADGRFVVTIEDVAEACASDTVVRLHGLEGVLGAALVCQLSDGAAPQEALAP